jgi:hypothetical protein
MPVRYCVICKHLKNRMHETWSSGNYGWVNGICEECYQKTGMTKEKFDAIYEDNDNANNS